MSTATKHDVRQVTPWQSEDLLPSDDPYVELEYHALMGVDGGDEPAHGRSFLRAVGDSPTDDLEHTRHEHEHDPIL